MFRVIFDEMPQHAFEFHDPVQIVPGDGLFQIVENDPLNSRLTLRCLD